MVKKQTRRKAMFIDYEEYCLTRTAVSTQCVSACTLPLSYPCSFLLIAMRTKKAATVLGPRRHACIRTQSLLRITASGDAETHSFPLLLSFPFSLYLSLFSACRRCRVRLVLPLPVLHS